MKRLLAACAAWAWLVSAAAPVPVDDALIQGDTLPPRLSDFHLLSGPFGKQPGRGVTRYTLRTPLFSDYAEKFRYAYVPTGKVVRPNGEGVIDFPVGSVIVKSFGYPADLRRPADNLRILETRLLIRRASGWVALPYVWNANGSEAVLTRAGKRIDVSWVHTDGTTRAISYAVPNVNQCKGCHDDGAGNLTLIGPKPRNIASGLPFARATLPIWNDPRTGTVAQRARAYLDVNCGHCHNRAGPANTSGLWLNWEQAADTNLGLLKRPTAAGRGSGGMAFAIAPGHPEQAYLPFRMKSLDPGIAMPELGRATVHDEGVALIEQWIAEMK